MIPPPFGSARETLAKAHSPEPERPVPLENPILRESRPSCVSDGMQQAYDRKSTVGKLARALDEAPVRGWSVVSMKGDWKKIFPAPD